jgi:hypothetical protein
MNQTSTCSLLGRDAHALDRLNDRELADIGLDRQGGVIIDANGRMVRRLPANVGFEWALREIFSAVHGGVARSAD